MCIHKHTHIIYIYIYKIGRKQRGYGTIGFMRYKSQSSARFLYMYIYIHDESKKIHVSLSGFILLSKI